jgi:uncharacterized protein YlxW (UPF0749 family)
VAATRGWHGGAVIVLGAAGLLMAAGITLADTSSVETSRGSDLPDLVEAETARVSELEEQAAALTAEVDDLAAGAGDAGTATLEQDVSVAAAYAGFSEVQGPGLTVTLSDAPVPDDLTDLPEGTTPDDFVVHQQDVEAVVNALWTGGAEAMQIMDRRITSVSAVRCVGNVIILDGQVYSPPFEITAIGDPTRLSQALESSDGVDIYRQWAEFIGLGYQVTEQEEVTLSAATAPPTLSFASHVEEDA